MCRALLLVGLIFLTGCTTGYHSYRNFIYYYGGYLEEPAPNKIKHISYIGTGFSSNERIQTFTLYRCAEVSKAMGKPYFAMYRSLSDVLINKKMKNPVVFPLMNSNRGYAYIVPKDSYTEGDISVQDIYERSQQKPFKKKLK